MRWNIMMLMLALALTACHSSQKESEPAEVNETEATSEPVKEETTPTDEPEAQPEATVEDDEFCLLPPEARDDDLGGKIKVGQVAPDFVVGTDDDGNEVKLSSYRGKTVLLFFWATWCPNCKIALKPRGSINNLGIEVRDTPDAQLVLLGIGTGHDETAEGQTAFIKTNEVPWRSVHDQDSKIESSYGVLGVPTCVVVGREGKVLTYGVYRKTQYKEPLIEYLRQECTTNAVYK